MRSALELPQKRESSVFVNRTPIQRAITRNIEALADFLGRHITIAEWLIACGGIAALAVFLIMETWPVLAVRITPWL